MPASRSAEETGDAQETFTQEAACEVVLGFARPGRVSPLSKKVETELFVGEDVEGAR